MTVTIPTWLLWLVGVPVVLAVLALACVGAFFLWHMTEW